MYVAYSPLPLRLIVFLHPIDVNFRVHDHFASTTSRTSEAQVTYMNELLTLSSINHIRCSRCTIGQRWVTNVWILTSLKRIGSIGDHMYIETQLAAKKGHATHIPSHFRPFWLSKAMEIGRIIKFRHISVPFGPTYHWNNWGEIFKFKSKRTELGRIAEFFWWEKWNFQNFRIGSFTIRPFSVLFGETRMLYKYT